MKEGDAFFVWIPTGCTEDEDVEISISTKEGQDELSICESVHNSKKHLRNK